LDKVHLEVYPGEALGLVGENGAGKSTLMNVISGVLTADKGKITLMGKEVVFRSPTDSQHAGIGFVHQELFVCPHMSVSENVFMGRTPTNKFGLIKRKECYANTKKYLDLFGVKFSPNAKVGELSTAEQQIVEIARALSLNCKLIIFDEPTSSLTESEAEKLFGIIHDLKAKGISILYISHRLPEIFELCERCTILKDGRYVDTLDVKSTTSNQIIQKMVGRDIEHLYPEKSKKVGDTVLQVRNFNKAGVFRDINFDVKKDEVLGFYGLVGAGRTELWRAICSIDPYDCGKLFIDGKELKFKTYKDAMNAGFAYLTEDRKLQGLFLEMQINQNISAADLKNVQTGLRIDKHKENRLCQHYVEKLNIKVGAITDKVASLSGGNQQKVMIGKWLATGAKIFIMDEPTRGIDVGAKSEIHNMLRELSKSGVNVIIISSELPEVIGMADRVIVMHEGAITGELQGKELSEETIVTYASAEILFEDIERCE